jgi:predicted phage-related endonuclease
MKVDVRELDWLEVRSLQEPSIIAAFEKAVDNKIKVERTDERFVHPEYSWLFANVDGLIGDDGIFEAKTTNEWMKHGFGEHESDEVPFPYYLQVQHYMLVLNRSFTWLGAFLGTDTFKAFYIERDEYLCQQIIERSKEFWHDHVLAHVAPDYIVADNISGRIETDPKKEVEASSEILESYSRLTELQSQSKALDKEIKQLKFDMQLFMNDAVALNYHDKCLAKISMRNTKSFDRKRFEVDHPELCTEYMQSKQSKALLIKG